MAVTAAKIQAPFTAVIAVIQAKDSSFCTYCKTFTLGKTRFSKGGLSISSQVPSTSSATLPNAAQNQGREDIAIRRFVEDLVDFFLFRILSFLTEIFVVVSEPVHSVPQNAHYFWPHGIKPL
jgi:hypothetical protein